MSFEKLIDERVLKVLRHRATQRAQQLKKEARGYWHSDRERFHQLNARSLEFKRFATMFEELAAPHLPAFPSNAAEVGNKSAQQARSIIESKREKIGAVVALKEIK